MRLSKLCTVVNGIILSQYFFSRLKLVNLKKVLYINFCFPNTMSEATYFQFNILKRFLFPSVVRERHSYAFELYGYVPL